MSQRKERAARDTTADHGAVGTEPGADQVQRFGALIRERRKAIGMTQGELAFASGLGRRFIVELEGGKASIQLGRALVVASAVGLRVLDLLEAAPDDAAMLPDDEDEPLP